VRPRGLFKLELKNTKMPLLIIMKSPQSLVEHSMKTKHHICIEDAKILARVDHLSKRCIREAMEIVKGKQMFE
jgi:hypothetical protein